MLTWPDEAAGTMPQVRRRVVAQAVASRESVTL